MIPQGLLVVVAEAAEEEERKQEREGGEQRKWKCPVCFEIASSVAYMPLLISILSSFFG